MPVGSEEVKAAFERELEWRNLRYGKESKGRNPNGPIVLTDCGSVGFCSIGVAVLVYPEGVWYGQVRAEDVPEIIEEHLLNGTNRKETGPDRNERSANDQGHPRWQKRLLWSS